MRKMIFAINITIDGCTDHTAVIADDELHDFHTGLLELADTLIMGRKTFRLMEEFWPKAHELPGVNESTLRFAGRINTIEKIVFSRTVKSSDWNNTSITENDLIEEAVKLKNRAGRNIAVGGLSIASVLSGAGLIDEYWFLIQPILLGKGVKLFEKLSERVDLKLTEYRSFNSGVMALHYKSQTVSV